MATILQRCYVAFVTSVACVAAWDNCLAQGLKSQALEIPSLRRDADGAKLVDSLARGVAASHYALNAYTSALIAVARDENGSIEVRKRAIFSIAEVDSDEAIMFLAKNVTLHLQSHVTQGDDDRASNLPCAYALSKNGAWNHVRVILSLLDVDAPAAAAMAYADVIESCLGDSRMAKAVLDAEIAKGGSKERENNLLMIQQYMNR